jgi:hypothetical protein
MRPRPALNVRCRNAPLALRLRTGDRNSRQNAALTVIAKTLFREDHGRELNSGRVQPAALVPDPRAAPAGGDKNAWSTA